jgi:hypothetical protein
VGSTPTSPRGRANLPGMSLRALAVRRWIDLTVWWNRRPVWSSRRRWYTERVTANYAVIVPAQRRRSRRGYCG